MDILSKPADEFENDQQLEVMWAMKAYEHADTYFNIITSVEPSVLQLTPYDDTIYTVFRETFPNLNIQHLNEDELKSSDGKIRWRNFCERFNFVEDYSYGTLLRTDASKDYNKDNSILTPRIQFYAIELARNREGLNKSLRKLFGRRTPKKETEE